MQLNRFKISTISSNLITSVNLRLLHLSSVLNLEQFVSITAAILIDSKVKEFKNENKSKQVRKLLSDMRNFVLNRTKLGLLFNFFKACFRTMCSWDESWGMRQKFVCFDFNFISTKFRFSFSSTVQRFIGTISS